MKINNYKDNNKGKTNETKYKTHVCTTLSNYYYKNTYEFKGKRRMTKN